MKTKTKAVVPAQASLLAFRSRWPWLKPYELALYGQQVVEIMNYPDTDYTVLVRMVIGDPTSMRQLLVEDLGELCWTPQHKAHYREGFIDGWAAAAAAARKRDLNR